MGKEIKNYKDLEVWQAAMEMAVFSYNISQTLPASEKFAMSDQLRRAAVSVPANIAEGHGSSHRKVFQNHLSIARGSLAELETYIVLAMRLGFLSEDEDNVKKLMNQIKSVAMMLNALLSALKEKP